jgi:hypothetical protein
MSTWKSAELILVRCATLPGIGLRHPVGRTHKGQFGVNVLWTVSIDLSRNCDQTHIGALLLTSGNVALIERTGSRHSRGCKFRARCVVDWVV